MKLILFKDYLNKLLLKLLFIFLVINLIISCKTNENTSSSLNAVSDSDFKLSLVKSAVSLDSDNSDLSASEFYDFSLCSKKFEGECVNVFATDDGAKVSINIEELKNEIFFSEISQGLASGLATIFPWTKKSDFTNQFLSVFSLDKSVDEPVDSVIDFVKKLALHLNTRVFFEEGDLKITQMCFPPQTNKNGYCKSIKNLKDHTSFKMKIVKVCKVKAIYNYAKAARQNSKKLVSVTVKTLDDLSKPAMIYPQDIKHYEEDLSAYEYLAHISVNDVLFSSNEKDLNFSIYRNDRIFSPRMMGFYIDQIYGYLREIGFIFAPRSGCNLAEKDFKPFSEDFLNFTQSYLEDLYGRMFLKNYIEINELNLTNILIYPYNHGMLKSLAVTTQELARINKLKLVRKYFSTGKSAKDMFKEKLVSKFPIIGRSPESMFKVKIFNHLQDLYSAELKLKASELFYKYATQVPEPINIQTFFLDDANGGFDLVRELKYYLETNVPPSYVCKFNLWFK